MSQAMLGISQLPLKPGVNAKSTIKELCSVTAKYPGIHAMYAGTQVEHPNVIDVLTKWESSERHEAYKTSKERDSMFEIVHRVLDTSHVDLMGTRNISLGGISQETQDKIFSAPVTQILIFAGFPSTFEDTLTPFEDEFKKVATGMLGDLRTYTLDQDRAKESVSMVGWISIDAHMESLKNNTHEKYLSGRENFGTVNMHYVALIKFDKES